MFIDECYKVNKGRCGWVSAEMMFLEETSGGPDGLIRAGAQDGALAAPYLPYRRVSWLLTPHYFKRDPSVLSHWNLHGKGTMGPRHP